MGDLNAQVGNKWDGEIANSDKKPIMNIEKKMGPMVYSKWSGSSQNLF